MQTETVSVTLELTPDEAMFVLTYLRDMREVRSVDPVPFPNSALPKTGGPKPQEVMLSHTIDGVTTAVVNPPIAQQPVLEVPPLVVPYAAPAVVQGPWTAPVAQPVAQPAPAPVSGPQTVPVSNLTAPGYTPPIGAPVPTAVPGYTLEQLALAAMPLHDAGRAAELTAMLAQFGVVALNQIPPDRFGDVAVALRGMGAQI